MTNIDSILDVLKCLAISNSISIENINKYSYYQRKLKASLVPILIDF